MSQILNNVLFYQYAIIFISFTFSCILGLIFFGLSSLIAVQNPDFEKMSAYECGFEPFEDARNKFDVRFYIIAILFIIFDIEVVYLFPWGVTLNTIGHSGFFVMLFFMAINNNKKKKCISFNYFV